MEHRNCQNCKNDFVISTDEMAMYNKTHTVPSFLCRHCRWKQYFAFWPFGKFRTGYSDFSGERFITVLPKDARYPIYTSKEWVSDSWDGIDHGMEYDETKSFFSQLKELQEKIPRPHQQGQRSVGCEWCDDAWESKNCYLSRSTLRSENLLYGYRTIDSKDSVDVSHVFNLDHCYDCTYCFASYNLNFSQNCKECIDSYFLFDCRNCSNCFMCTNLRGKNYYIFNQEYSKEEYFKKLNEFSMASYEELSKLKERYKKMIENDTVHRENFNLKTYNSIGSYMNNCNNCIEVYSWEDSEQSFNCLRGLKTRDTIDQVGCWSVELSGNNSCCTDGYDIHGCIWSDHIKYSDYLDQCMDCEYCFGCVGLKKKKYCILNKQYTQEEYFILKEKIIQKMQSDDEYGQFPPFNMGLCQYNFSTAMIYFPNIKKEYINNIGGYWDENKEDILDGMHTKDIPDDISFVNDEFSQQALICPETGWRFNISSSELEFLKQKNFALPRVHFDVRTLKRLEIFSCLEGENYNCCYCNKDIIAYYPKSWDYKKVSCINCYQQNIN